MTVIVTQQTTVILPSKETGGSSVQKRKGPGGRNLPLAQEGKGMNEMTAAANLTRQEAPSPGGIARG
jgi:hypothetical protein